MLIISKRLLVASTALSTLLPGPAMPQQNYIGRHVETDIEVSNQEFLDLDVTDDLESLPDRPTAGKSDKIIARDNGNGNIEQR